MGISTFDHVVRLLSIVFAVAVIVRIVQQRLFAPPLPSFACMLGIVLLRDLIVSVPSYDSHAYAVAWEATLPALLIAQIWAGLDTLRAVACVYPKFGKFALKLFLTCLAITIGACCLSLPFELRRLISGETLLRSWFLLQRSVDGWISGTLILVAIFLARFPAPAKQPPRNLVLHTLLLSLYFSGYSVLFMAENLAPLGGVVLMERAAFVLIVALYAAWAVCLSKEGERHEPWPQIDVIVLKSVGSTAS
ncbi:MAG: hypothetical protein JO211_17355 [Acidobacteriaceae bacterium]|nr:hypothetical protein [Acidobacteriaceae bacterium]